MQVRSQASLDHKGVSEANSELIWEALRKRSATFSTDKEKEIVLEVVKRKVFFAQQTSG
jgi:hypothetical protein